MPRDYSRYRDERPRGRGNTQSRRRSEPSSGMTWLLVGVIIGLCIAGLTYLNQNKEHLTQLAAAVSTSNDQQAAANNSSTARHNTGQHKATPTPKFDFYKMLPAAQVSEPTVNDDTTSDKSNIAVKNPAPISAQANAILSGVTPPPNMHAGVAGAANNSGANNATTNNAEDNNTADNNAATNNATQTSNSENESEQASATANNNRINTTVQNSASLSEAAISGKYVIQIAAFRHFQDADQLKAQLAFSGFEAQITKIQKGKVNLERVWLGPYTTFNEAAAIQRKLTDNQIKSTLMKVD